MWEKIEKGFQIAFEGGWRAYKSKTIPIGACILNHKDDIMSRLAISINQKVLCLDANAFTQAFVLPAKC